jgi:hypothetical protein
MRLMARGGREVQIAAIAIEQEVGAFLMNERHPAISLLLSLEGGEAFEAGLMWAVARKCAPVDAGEVLLSAPALRRLASLWVSPPWYWVPQWHQWLISFAPRHWHPPEKDGDGWRLRADHVRLLVAFVLGSAWIHDMVVRPLWWHLLPEDRRRLVVAVVRGLTKHYLPHDPVDAPENLGLQEEVASAAAFTFGELDDIIISRLVDGAGGMAAVLRIDSSDTDVISIIRKIIKRSDVLAPYRGGGSVGVLPIKASGEGAIILKRLKSIVPHVTLAVDEFV